jgi:hypothetical protein
LVGFTTLPWLNSLVFLAEIPVDVVEIPWFLVPGNTTHGFFFWVRSDFSCWSDHLCSLSNLLVKYGKIPHFMVKLRETVKLPLLINFATSPEFVGHNCSNPAHPTSGELTQKTIPIPGSSPGQTDSIRLMMCFFFHGK